MTTKFKVIGIANEWAKLQRIGGGFLAFTEADKYFESKIGDIIELRDKDFISEGQMKEFNAAWDIYFYGYATHHEF